MADDQDLDSLVLEAAEQYRTSDEGVRTKLSGTINKTTIGRTITPPKKHEGWISGILHGASLPGTGKEIKEVFTNPASYIPPFIPISPPSWSPTKGPRTGMGVDALLDLFGHAVGRSGEQWEQAINALKENRYLDAYGHGVAGAAPIIGPNIAEGNYPRAVGNVISALLPFTRRAAVKAVPEQFKSDLINKGVYGEGALSENFKKDYGLALRRSKQGAIRRGSLSNRSAGINKETGFAEANTKALDEATARKQQLLQHPQATTPTISIKEFIEQNFGPVTTNPITGKIEVHARVASNIADTPAVSQLDNFATNLYNDLLERSMRSGGKPGFLSPAAIEELRHSQLDANGVFVPKAIDANYGKFSPDAPTATANQKAVAVSNDLFKRAEDALRLPSGESALELINSQIAGIMQGVETLPGKIREMRTTPSRGPLQWLVDKAIPPGVKKAITLNSQKATPGFNAGPIAAPLKTGLASWLTDKPWWLKNPTKGLKIPPEEVWTAIPEEPFGPTGGPKLPPSSPGGVPNALGPSRGQNLGPASIQLLSGETTPPRASSALIDFPPEPTHVVVGNRVTGFDASGMAISGRLEKLYATIENGVPTWKAVVLDLKKGKTVELSADQVYNALQGPPGTKKAVGPAVELPGSRAAAPSETKGPPLPRGTNRIVDKPPGTEGEGIFGDPKKKTYSKPQQRAFSEGMIVRNKSTGQIYEIKKIDWNEQLGQWEYMYEDPSAPAGYGVGFKHNLELVTDEMLADLTTANPESVMRRSLPLGPGTAGYPGDRGYSIFKGEPFYSEGQRPGGVVDLEVFGGRSFRPALKSKRSPGTGGEGIFGDASGPKNPERFRQLWEEYQRKYNQIQWETTERAAVLRRQLRNIEAELNHLSGAPSGMSMEFGTRAGGPPKLGPGEEFKGVTDRYGPQANKEMGLGPYKPSPGKIPRDMMPTSEDMDLIYKLIDKGMSRADAASTVGRMRSKRWSTLQPYESQTLGNEWDRIMEDPQAYRDFFEKALTRTDRSRGNRPPGTKGDGIFGDPENRYFKAYAHSPEAKNAIVPTEALDRSFSFENMAVEDPHQSSPFVDDFVRNQVGRQLGYSARSFQPAQHPEIFEPYTGKSSVEKTNLGNATKTLRGDPPVDTEKARTVTEEDTQNSNITSIIPKLAEKKFNELMGRIERGAGIEEHPNATSSELIDAAKKLKFLLRSEDWLGFDSLREAMVAIREHPDWVQRWNVTNPDVIKFGEAWRKLVAKPEATVIPFRKTPEEK